jgi:Leucine-rich repeat (LRR) protein
MENNQNNKLFIGLMIVLSIVLLAGIGIILFFLLRNTDAKDQKEGTVVISETEEPTKPPVKETALPTTIEGETIPSEKPDPSSPAIETEPPATVTETPTEPTNLPDTPAPETEPPTAEPATEPPTEPPATPLPDSFLFGGVTVKRGETNITGSKAVDGKKINGDSKGLKHITADEVEMLVLMCPDLKTLDLDYCWFDTYEPLSKLTKLEHLELKSCGTSNAGVPLTEIEFVRPLVNLKKLNLCHNQISDLDPLKNLKKLQYLQLGDNKINDDELEIIAKLENLTELYLYKNAITDASKLKKLSKVTILNLAYNKGFKNLDPLAEMKSLKDLRINNTGVKTLAALSMFKKLEVINVAGLNLGFSEYYGYMPFCPNLKKFKISRKDGNAILAGDALLNDGYNIDYEFVD